MSLSLSLYYSSSIEFEQGALVAANEFRVTDIADREAAMTDIENLAGVGVAVNLPGNEASGYKRIDPVTIFEGAEGMGTVSIDLDSTIDPSNVVIQRASSVSAWVFEPLDTEIIDGRAVAQTDRGGYFVVSTPVQYGLVVGIPIAIVLILLIVVIIIGVLVYFRVRPEKWASAKENVHKTQVKVKRSFAKQV